MRTMLHSPGFRTFLLERSATIIVFAVLLAAIAVVELGWRDPSAGIAVEVPVPEAIAPTVEQLRAIPQRYARDPAVGAIVAGVVFGRADDVSASDQQAFLDSGLWHLLAASGQNIALVTACCILLARTLGAGRTTGSVLALAAIPLYVMIVGGGASIVRAGITGVLVIVAWLSGRLADARHILIVVAAITCIVWPGAHRGLGMQLSYACVAALVTWAVPLTAALQTRGIPRTLSASIAVTGLCSVATAPILQLRTGAAPLLGIAANLVAVPTAGALLVIGLAGSLLALGIEHATTGAASIARLSLLPADMLGTVLATIARRAAAAPLASTSLLVVNLGIPLACGASMVVHRHVSRSRMRRAAFVATTLLIAALALVDLGRSAHAPGFLAPMRSLPAPQAAGVLRVAVLDVGQGDATLLALDGHAILVDAGPPSARVVKRVRELGVSHLDALVLTHDSLDHRGGYDEVRSALDPAWIARPHAAPGPWAHVEQTAPRLVDLCAGDAFDLAGAHIDVLHPRCDGTIAPRTGDIHNDGAMVLLVSHGDVRVLLPADAESPVLVGLAIGAIDLLRIPHHGSSDPQLPTLLARTQPRAAAISVGDGNTYGHPTRQVLESLDVAGVPMWRTDRDGTIAFDSDGRSLQLAR